MHCAPAPTRRSIATRKSCSASLWLHSSAIVNRPCINMAAVIRRLPLLARRGITSAACMPAMPPAALMAARAHRGLASFRAIWLQRSPLSWKSTSRSFSVASQPEGAEDSVTQAEAPPALDFSSANEGGAGEAESFADAGEGSFEAAAGGAPPASTRVFVHNIAWSVDDQVRGV